MNEPFANHFTADEMFSLNEDGLPIVIECKKNEKEGTN